MDNSAPRPQDLDNDLPVILRGSELLNLLVMDRATMQEVGRIERLWMYPQAHRVLGIICKGGGLFGQKRWAYKLPQIDALGKGSLWLEGPGAATSNDQVRQLETLINHEIWVDGGDRIGVIGDCLFNRKTGQITQYLFTNSRLGKLIDAANPLRPEEILSFGNQRALVSPQAVVRLRRERPSLRETFGQIKNQAKAEYEQVTTEAQDRLRNWGEEAKTTKERLAEQAELLSQQAAERARALQNQLTEQSQTLGEKAGETLSEQSQTLGQQAERRYRRIQRRARDFIEELPPLEQVVESVGWGTSDAHDSSHGTNWDDSQTGTWVDQGGERPPGRSLRQRRQESSAPSDQPFLNEPFHSHPTRPTDRKTDGTTDGPTENFVSRDNPWGYADGATESDWDELDLEPTAPQQSSPNRPDEPGHYPESRPFTPAELENIAPEDLEDSDPWI